MTQRYRNVHRDPRVLIKMMEEISGILPVHVTHEDVIRMVLLFVSNYAYDSFSAEEILTCALEDVREMYDKWGDRDVITCEVWQ